MILKKQQIEDVILIEAECHTDERGLFRRHYCEKKLKDKGIDFTVKQGNISENLKKHTIRGFHYQLTPSNESKIISCISGCIFNVVIDMRKNSPTYLQYQEFNISASGKESLYIPVGCANAFLTLEANSWVHYYMNDFFTTESLGFRYDDPTFAIKWPVKPEYMSYKDRNYPDLNLSLL